MDREVWTRVDQYFADLLLPADPVLDAALATSAASDLPAINVSANQGRLLEVLARACGARRILEIGTLGGYSTIWLGRTLLPDGQLVTLEASPKHADVARENLARAGLAGIVQVHIGPANETLSAMVAEGSDPFDLIFIDADKPGYTDYLGWAVRLSRPGTLIIADNVVRDGAVADPETTDERVQGIRRFTEALAAEPRLAATAVQTVGAKGYDGFTLAVVTS